MDNVCVVGLTDKKYVYGINSGPQHHFKLVLCTAVPKKLDVYLGYWRPYNGPAGGQMATNFFADDNNAFSLYKKERLRTGSVLLPFSS